MTPLIILVIILIILVVGVIFAAIEDTYDG